MIEKDKRETTNKRKLRKSQMSSSNSDLDKQSHVFGVSLDELVKRNQRGGVIPDFVIKVFRYLRDTGKKKTVFNDSCDFLKNLLLRRIFLEF